MAAWDKSYNEPMIDTGDPRQVRGPRPGRLRHALRLKPDYFEAMTYYNLLFREKAKLEESDPLKAQEWYRQGGEVARQGDRGARRPGQEGSSGCCAVAKVRPQRSRS